MSFYRYNVERNELLKTYDEAEKNVNGPNPYDETYKSYESIHIESENILLREQTVFIMTSTVTVLLVTYALQQL